MRSLSSGQVADLLKVHYHRLDYLTRDRQIRPVKGPTGAFLWTLEEVQRAAQLLNRPLPTVELFDAAAAAGIIR